MWKWLHHLLNPHCVECSQQAECKSCETLREQLYVANETNRQLTLTIVELNRPVPVAENTTRPVVAQQPIGKRRVPWAVKQAILEQEDRVKAKVTKEAPKPEEEITISSLEQELDAVEQARLANAKVN